MNKNLLIESERDSEQEILYKYTVKAYVTRLHMFMEIHIAINVIK